MSFGATKGAQYFPTQDVISMFDPDWSEEVDPHVNWSDWWGYVAHEIAHKIHYEWFHQVSHNDLFYAILLAVTCIWDMDLDVYQEGEHWYHPRNLKNGKLTAGVLLMRIMNQMANHEISDGPIDFPLPVCADKSCTLHTYEYVIRVHDTAIDVPKQPQE